MSSYQSLAELRRAMGAKTGTPMFAWATDDNESMDRAEEREKALQVLYGTARFTSEEIQRIIARLVLRG